MGSPPHLHARAHTHVRTPKAGSDNGSTVPDWERAYAKAGFTTYVEDRRGKGEQSVDDVIHAQAMKCLGLVRLPCEFARTV